MSKSNSGSTSALKVIIQKSQQGKLVGVNPTYLKSFRYVSYLLFIGLIAILPNLVNGLQLRLATLASICTLPRHGGDGGPFSVPATQFLTGKHW